MKRKTPNRDDYNNPRRTNDSLIARLRIERGLTQADLSLALGLTPTHVSKWERGICKPKTKSLVKLSEVLGVDLMTLIKEYE